MTLENESNVPMWAILELMGHVKTGALISKDTQFGTAMLRADVPQKDGSMITQLVNTASIYRITFCEEKIARACAEQCATKPMDQWELRHLLPAPPILPQDDPDAPYIEDDNDDGDDMML